jgi:hypothetical protein
MDEMAPAPAQRTSNDRGQRPAENFSARKKAAKKVSPEPAIEPSLELEPVPTLEPEPKHQLDVLA